VWFLTENIALNEKKNKLNKSTNNLKINRFFTTHRIEHINSVNVFNNYFPLTKLIYNTSINGNFIILLCILCFEKNLQKYWFRMRHNVRIIEVVVIDGETSIFLSISIFFKTTLNLFYWYGYK